ncbi:MAG: radical SAM protein [Vicinamibacteria bacterium]|nr:radical SAM protein [Vicinamibacteria bacterium]
MKRVLLLNPPAPDLVVRDYYCSKTTRSNYIFEPVDLLMQSGRLARHFDVAVLDAVVDRLDEETCRRRILALRPDAILFLTGAVSWNYDFPFLRDVKERLGGTTTFIGSGDVFLDDTERWLEENPFIDAAILDFVNDDATLFLLGRKDALETIVFRAGGVIRAARRPRARGAAFECPLPRHDLFVNPRYHFSFARSRPFATVLTDFGCPYSCSFCVMSGLGFKFRGVDNVMEELRRLKAAGVREIFFIDQTWGVRRERNLALCRRMTEERLDLGWTTFTRVDVFTPEILAAWRRAGCHTLILGVESASADTLQAYRKGYHRDKIAHGLRMVREAGIRTVGTFILGLPEDTRETVEATIRLACALPLDFASFSVAVPRFGTPLREQARAEGLIGDTRVMDQSGATVAMATRVLTREEVRRLTRKAVLRFYLRPSYLIRRALSTRSWWELITQAREGLALAARNIGFR